jgi:hypothetical protein
MFKSWQSEWNLTRFNWDYHQWCTSRRKRHRRGTSVPNRTCMCSRTSLGPVFFTTPIHKHEQDKARLLPVVDVPGDERSREERQEECDLFINTWLPSLEKEGVRSLLRDENVPTFQAWFQEAKTYHDTDMTLITAHLVHHVNINVSSIIWTYMVDAFDYCVDWIYANRVVSARLDSRTLRMESDSVQLHNLRLKPGELTFCNFTVSLALEEEKIMVRLTRFLQASAVDYP